MQFFVNGTQGSIQLREVPKNGTWIKIADGMIEDAPIFKLTFSRIKTPQIYGIMI